MSQDKPNPSSMQANLPSGSHSLSSEERAAIMREIQEKLQSLPAASPIGSLPEAVKARVIALQTLQRSHDELKDKFLEEKAALEAKYLQLYQPLYSKRFDIVNGVVDVAAEQKPAGDDESIKGVPEFWLTAMKSNEILAEQVTVRDEGCLKYLRDITWSHLGGDQKGFKIEFHFDQNPYFKNTVLVKSYHMIDEEEPILEKAEGTEIDWFPGKNLTVKVLKKKPKKGAKSTKPITKTEPCDSFFNFFSPPPVPTDEEELDEEEAEELQDLMEQDYDIGSVLKEKIIPQAVLWYTGEAAEAEYGELEEDELDEDEEEGAEEREVGGEGEEGDDDEDDEDDEEEEEEEKPVKKPASGGKGKGRK